MTDAEVIKALPQIKYGGCKGCTYGILSGDDRCGMKGCKIARDALTLIQRQQADIIMLEQNRVTFPERIKIVDNARKQAVREFAEVMKENLQNVAKEEIMGCEYYLIGLSFIDNLAKEFGKDINVLTNPEQVEGE